MSDNKKWFKVWSSILLDPHHANLSLENVGRWTRLGALMVSQGNNGRLAILPPASALCFLMGCSDFTALIEVLKVLPNVTIEYAQNDNGSITVSFSKWFKYQMDSTGYERVKRSRYKRREDKIRSKSTSFLTSRASRPAPLAGASATREIDPEELEQKEQNKQWQANTKENLNEPEIAKPEEVKAIMEKWRQNNPRYGKP